MQSNTISSPKFKVTRFNPHREHMKTQILSVFKPRASLPKVQKRTAQLSLRSELPLIKMQSMGSPIMQSCLLDFDKINCVQHSETGMLGGEKKKYNQDSIRVTRMQNGNLFMVCDGHGSQGHLISTFVSSTLSQLLIEGLDRNSYMLQYNTQLHNTVIKGAFQKTSTQLIQSQLPTQRSGSTCNMVLMVQQNIIPNNSYDFSQDFEKETVIYCANVGDSRTIIVSKGIRGGLIVNQLSMDHRLDIEEEKNRIKQKGGIIQSLERNGEQIGPLRVWLDEMKGSGLAMSRSFGDTQMQSVGVISDPTIYESKIKTNDLFLVTASDGVWEYLSNMQVAKIIYEKIEQQDQAAKYLVEKAQLEWKQNDIAIDDTSCIVVFFNQ